MRLVTHLTPRGSNAAEMAARTFDWPALNMTDRRLFVSPSLVQMFLRVPSQREMLNKFIEISPADLGNIPSCMSGYHTVNIT